MITILRKWIFVGTLALTLLGWNTCVQSEPLATASGPHIVVELVSEYTSWQPGGTAVIGIHLQPEEMWHTYWRNSGDSGEAPVINITSVPELEFGEIHWPLPKAIPVAHLVNYGYEGSNLLILTAPVPDDLTSESIQVNASLSWLVCKEDCIPGSAELSLTMPLSANVTPSVHAALFEQTRQTWPSPKTLQGQFEVNQEHIVVEVDTDALPGFDVEGEWRMFPFSSVAIDHAAPQRPLLMAGKAQFVLSKSPYFDDATETLNWLLSNGQSGYYLSTTMNVVSPQQTHSSSAPLMTLQEILLVTAMAFLGGLILNVMPCVLPVLSIKALALQQDKGPLLHQWAYCIGVLVSFNAFAAIIIALQISGEQVGWGFHMQHPYVVVVLSFLFTFIALVLFDALQVGTRLSGVGQSLVGGSGFSAHFATGVLAVIVASPCTAPFMAAALGVALVSDAAVTLLIFNALALGFALPMTLLFASTRVRARLPKPGKWMVTLKHLLAFPMLATVAWLCFVYLGQTNSAQQFVLMVSLVGFALGVYLLNQTRRPWVQGIAILGLLVALITPFSLQTPMPSTTTSAASSDFTIAFDAHRLEQLRAGGEIVVVNMTADWCITCKVNEQIAFTDSALKTALKQDGVTYMVGDWTNKNQDILDYLSQYQRAGVPLYVVYAGDKSAQILPQILTPKIVLDAIARAKQELQQ